MMLAQLWASWSAEELRWEKKSDRNRKINSTIIQVVCFKGEGAKHLDQYIHLILGLWQSVRWTRCPNFRLSTLRGCVCCVFGLYNNGLRICTYSSTDYAVSVVLPPVGSVAMIWTLQVQICCGSIPVIVIPELFMFRLHPILFPGNTSHVMTMSMRIGHGICNKWCKTLSSFTSSHRILQNIVASNV